MTATLPLFRSDTQEAVLRAVFESDEPLTSAEIARHTGHPTSSVSREVRSLERTGLLEAEPAGRRVLIRPNEASPYTTGLRLLLGASRQRRFRPSTPLGWTVARHRAELVRLAHHHGLSRPRLFGSVARGDDGPGSDVDILVDVPKDRSLTDVAAFAAAASDLLDVTVDVADSQTLLPAVVRSVARQAVDL